MKEEGMSKAEWSRVIRALENLGPYYERVNLAATFFFLPFWRREAAKFAKEGDVALEIGSGPGGFAKILPCKEIYCLDPSSFMLSYSRSKLNGGRFRFLKGVGEYIPMKSESIDLVFCIFSFRDFFEKTRGTQEIYRVLRTNGEIHIVEISQPDSPIRRKILNLWIERFAPFIGAMLVPREMKKHWSENPYVEFMKTYHALGSAQQYVQLLSRIGFRKVEVKYLALKGVFHLTGVK